MKIELDHLTAPELDLLIEEAAKRRATMEPALPGERPALVEAALNPIWSVSIVPGGSLFQIGHKSYGWLSFVIPPIQRVQLMSVLLQHSLLPEPPAEEPSVPTPVTAGPPPVH